MSTLVQNSWTTIPNTGGAIGTTVTIPNIASYTVTSFDTNTPNMNKQVKVAVFEVKRNEKNEIIQSKFVSEFWIERKPGTPVDFAVAKLLDNKYEADQIVIKEVQSINL